tara:strand:+ start:273 stop:989 length:717 start_codon:yes stop_codon:yes gene_type:complete
MNIIDVYDEYIDNKRKKNEDVRYKDFKDWFHASGTGTCVRKHYYANVAKMPRNPKSRDTLRLFRLGDIVHTDIQAAVSECAKKEGTEVFIETEIRLPELNVRGFLDLVVVEDSALYDIKTCNSRKFKTIQNGKLNNFNEPTNYYMQLGTYGHWYEKHTGNPLEKLALLYYNKDTSEMLEFLVPRNFMDRAIRYWKQVKKEFEGGIPNVRIGFAPVKKWECNELYCDFYDTCGGGLNDN